MNWDQLEGQWAQLKGQVKAKWGKLTDDDLTTLAGKRQALVGKVKERYGIVEEQATKQVDEWIATLGHTKDKVVDAALKVEHKVVDGAARLVDQVKDADKVDPHHAQKEQAAVVAHDQADAAKAAKSNHG